MVAMSEILQEVTEWKSDFSVPNHIYLLDNNSNIIAYTKSDGTINQLKSSIKLNKRYRKFITVKHTGLSKLIKNDNQNNTEKTGIRIFKVKSKDKEYNVELYNNKLSCNCTGFGFRNKCKHIEAVKAKL